MNRDFIIGKTLDVYRRCAVTCFPLDCVWLLEGYDHKVFSYGELREINGELYQMCLACSDDAFRDGSSGIVAYNEHMPEGRIRFSLMHELGHIVLGHRTAGAAQEREANRFASHVLAPRAAIHHARCQSPAEISLLFGISAEAAEYAYEDYRRWRRLSAYRPSENDRRMYAHFYDPAAGQFVYRKSHCARCRKPLFNSEADLCPACHSMRSRERRKPKLYFPAQSIPDGRLFAFLHNGV